MSDKRGSSVAEVAAAARAAVEAAAEAIAEATANAAEGAPESATRNAAVQQAAKKAAEDVVRKVRLRTVRDNISNAFQQAAGCAAKAAFNASAQGDVARVTTVQDAARKAFLDAIQPTLDRFERIAKPPLPIPDADTDQHPEPERADEPSAAVQTAEPTHKTPAEAEVRHVQGATAMPLQTYGTTLFAPHGDKEFHFLIVPARSMSERPSGLSIDDLCDSFSLTDRISVRPAFVANALAALHWTKGPSGPLPASTSGAALREAYNGASASADFAFAEEVAYARLLPWEASPLGSESLGSLITGSGAMAVGAKLGLGALALTGAPVTVPLFLACAGGGAIIAYATAETIKPAAAEIGGFLSDKVRDLLGRPPRGGGQA